MLALLDVEKIGEKKQIMCKDDFKLFTMEFEKQVSEVQKCEKPTFQTGVPFQIFLGGGKP